LILGLTLAPDLGATTARGSAPRLAPPAVYGVALLVSDRATRTQHIPFGPLMIAGAFAVILAWHGAGSHFG
jgi:hypothetical protein